MVNRNFLVWEEITIVWASLMVTLILKNPQKHYKRQTSTSENLKIWGWGWGSLNFEVTDANPRASKVLFWETLIWTIQWLPVSSSINFLRWYKWFKLKRVWMCWYFGQSYWTLINVWTNYTYNCINFSFTNINLCKL